MGPHSCTSDQTSNIIIGETGNNSEDIRVEKKIQKYSRAKKIENFEKYVAKIRKHMGNHTKKAHHVLKYSKIIEKYQGIQSDPDRILKTNQKNFNNDREST